MFYPIKKMLRFFDPEATLIKEVGFDAPTKEYSNFLVDASDQINFY